MFKFSTCISGKKVPMDFGLLIVPVILPRGNVASHRFQIGDLPVQTLSVHGIQFNLGHVEPTAMFGRVMDLRAFRQLPGFLRFKNLVERGKTMGFLVFCAPTPQPALLPQIAFSGVRPYEALLP